MMFLIPLLPLLTFLIVGYVLFLDEKMNPQMVKFGELYAIQFGYVKHSYLDLDSGFKWGRDSRWFVSDCLGTEEKVRVIYTRLIEEPEIVK